MMIEALLFDLGKVLIDFNFELGMNRFLARTPLPAEEFKAILQEQNWVRKYEHGHISSAEYHRYLRNHGKLDMSIEEFHEAWSAVFLPELIVPESLLARLKTRYPLILVSNTNESHAEFIARKYRVLDYFDHKIFSHEVGSMKPDRQIYDAAIAAAARPPEALFFADDRPENVESAARLGIHAHQFETVSGLVNAMRNHGVELGDFVPA
ncbi:MAG TPA: HAD family phosphatase [Terriglobia bacterium]|nr:HAD family phosphatase [Terriglobia bacterium]